MQSYEQMGCNLNKIKILSVKNQDIQAFFATKMHLISFDFQITFSTKKLSKLLARYQSV